MSPLDAANLVTRALLYAVSLGAIGAALHGALGLMASRRACFWLAGLVTVAAILRLVILNAQMGGSLRAALSAEQFGWTWAAGAPPCPRASLWCRLSHFGQPFTSPGASGARRHKHQRELCPYRTFSGAGGAGLRAMDHGWPSSDCRLLVCRAGDSLASVRDQGRRCSGPYRGLQPGRTRYRALGVPLRHLFAVADQRRVLWPAQLRIRTIACVQAYGGNAASRARGGQSDVRHAPAGSAARQRASRFARDTASRGGSVRRDHHHYCRCHNRFWSNYLRSFK